MVARILDNLASQHNQTILISLPKLKLHVALRKESI